MPETLIKENAVMSVPIGLIYPNPWNRTVFDEKALEELAASIKTEGIREPLIVRLTTREDIPYEIASGNRRWLAAQKAGLKDVPCLVEELSDEQVAEDNITMNIQREDIPPLELARMVKAYMDNFNKRQIEAARAFGKSKTWVSQLLRFLKMDPAAIEKFNALNFGWFTLRQILPLGTDLTAVIVKELNDGSLKPDRVIKRCRQLLYGSHSKGGFKKEAPPPPDPLKNVWPPLQKDLDFAPDVHWQVKYGFHKPEVGPALTGWFFFVSPSAAASQPKAALGTWFKQMGEAFSGGKYEPALSQVIQDQQAAEKKLADELGPVRLPKSAEEEKELEGVATRGTPKDVYTWIYGKGHMMVDAAPATWKEIGMNPVEGLKQILEGIREFQKI